MGYKSKYSGKEVDEVVEYIKSVYAFIPRSIGDKMQDWITDFSEQEVLQVIEAVEDKGFALVMGNEGYVPINFAIEMSMGMGNQDEVIYKTATLTSSYIYPSSIYTWGYEFMYNYKTKEHSANTFYSETPRSLESEN